MRTSPELLASLQEDLALEHGAILQYLIHALLLRDSPLTDPVRKVAREEMWHFEWLAEAIRDRGGEPALDRADMFLSVSTTDNMAEDVVTEQGALSHYARTLELIGDSDPKLSLLIERIADDERHHRATFERLESIVREGGDAAYAAHPIIGPEDLAVVGPTIGLEYGAILQNLLNKYGCGDCDRGEEYFELAVDDMRHLGWAANYVPGFGPPQPPPVPTDTVRSVRSGEEAAEAAKRIEGVSAAFYAEKVGQAKSPELADDLARAASQHAYHLHKLG
jgi:bacterioferritin